MRPRCRCGVRTLGAKDLPFFAMAPVQAAGLVCRAIAQTKPESSRATATTTLLRGTRRVASLRKRAQRRSCALQAVSQTLFESALCRRAITQDTRAGWA